MIITVDGKEIDIPHKRIRLDALFEKAGLDPMEDKLVLIDAERNSTDELCSLHLVIEIFDEMCFVTC